MASCRDCPVHRDVGPNELTTDTATPKWLLFLSQFCDVLVIVVVVVVATISFGIGSFRGGMVMVIIIVVVNALIGFVQEYKVIRILESLRQLIRPPAKILVDGDFPRSRRTSSSPVTSGLTWSSRRAWRQWGVVHLLAHRRNHYPLSVRVTIQSPDNSNYDVVCWPGACSRVSMQGESTNGPGQPDIVGVLPGDNTFEDDSEYIAVQIVEVVGRDCGPFLLVEGNTAAKRR